MNWYHSARTVNELAAQYVLGTLKGRARRRFEAVAAQRPDVAARVQEWEGQLHRLAQALPVAAPSAALWERMAHEAGLPATAATPAAQGVVAQVAAPAVAGAAAVATAVATAVTPAALKPAATPPATAPAVQAPAALTPVPPVGTIRTTRTPPAAPSLMDRLSRALQSLLSPVPAGALAFGLMAGLALPTVMQLLNPPVETGESTSVPASYIGVLATPDGRQGLIVASLRRGRTVDLKQVTPVQPGPGQTLFLWTLDAKGQVRAVGAIPAGTFVQAPLPDVAENVFAQAVELGVTMEAVGAAPAAPSGPWVYRGLCGKVWRAPPPAAAAPAAPTPRASS